MKLVTLALGDGTDRVGAVDGDRVVDLAAAARDIGRGEAPLGTMLTLLNAGPTGLDLAAELVEAARRGAADWHRPLADLRLRAPVPTPGKILCVAGNYAEHWRESGLDAPSKQGFEPQTFIKPVTTVIGPDDQIRPPGAICTAVDYEGELVAIVGTPGRDIPAERALDHVAGYANYNDVSGRKLTITTPRPDSPRTRFFDWLNGKWFDTFGPLGPWLVTADEVGDPQALTLQTRVNGVVRQNGTTADMIYTVAETIAWISRFTTLEPGDLIATGTPSGVGAATGTYLVAGDVVEVEIERLGVLRNSVGAATETRGDFDA